MDKALQKCRKRTKDSTLEPQEPDRLLHREEYESEEHKPLLAGGEGDNSDHCPHNTDTETYPACGNSPIGPYIALWHNVENYNYVIGINDFFIDSIMVFHLPL